MAMGLHTRGHPRAPSYLLCCVLALSFFSISALLLYKVDDFVSQTKTLAGHNLEPTPWHIFPRKTFDDETRRTQAYKIIQCTYFACPYIRNPIATTTQQLRGSGSSEETPKCPDFFRFIHHDLEPWAKTRISVKHVMEAKKYAAFRVVIIGGRLYVDLYYACVQSRAMFTIWAFLQLLKRFPGMVPDVDIMFDCMDKPSMNRTEHEPFPLPLFRYCTNEDHFDIPFPDWSFWGWSETNIKPWNEQFQEIKQGSKRTTWSKKLPHAYWKGNPDVVSPIRLELLTCNDSTRWGAQIMRQNWEEEAKAGYEKSKLSNQCNHQYKIYAEGYAWSVSLKYILSCGSLTLIITPQYEDFFSRGLIPRKNYWPVSPANLCPSIKSAVDWGTANPSEAEAIGKRGQRFMESLSMDRIYDYMFHLIIEYSKLQDFKPTRPSSALDVCEDSLLCFAEPKERQLLERSTASPSSASPCTLPAAESNFIKRWKQKKKKVMEEVRNMELPKADQVSG